MGLTVHRVVNGSLRENAYLLWDGPEAIAIDPGFAAARLLELIGQEELQLRFILATHIHADHIGEVETLGAATGARFGIHELDLALEPSASAEARTLGLPAVRCPPPDLLVRDRQHIVVGPMSLEVLHTPGHSPGSVSYAIEDRLFTGDTLFRTMVGPTRFAGGDSRALHHSLHDVLLRLPPSTTVYPGHGMPTTIGYELQHNRSLRGGTAASPSTP